MYKKQQGISLIEILIALGLGASLLIGLVQIYQGNSQTNNLVNAFSRVQESGRIASELMSRDIRMADYWGCLKDKELIANRLDQADARYAANVSEFNWVEGDAVDGLDNTAAALVDGMTVINGTDVLFLRSSHDACSGNGRPVDSDNSGEFYVSSGCDANVDPGDMLVVTSCDGGDLFTVSSMSGSGTAARHILHTVGACGDANAHCVPNIDANFSEEYNRSARILKPVMTSYFIAAGTGGASSLYMKKNKGNPIELVDGIEDMQISYGQDTNDDGAVDIYSGMTNEVVKDNILSVRIQLTVTNDQVVGTSEDDNQLRKTFVATSSVRNRTL